MRTVRHDRWLSLEDLSKMLGLSERTLLKLRVTRGLPLRRATRKATPGALESELLAWIRAQPWPGEEPGG